MDLLHGIQDSATGTTTGSYVNALQMAISPIKSTSFVIKNTGGAESMYYKVLIYRNADGSYSEEYVTETSIAAGGQDEVNINDTPHTKAIVQVKSNSGATTYGVEGVQLRG